MSDQPPLSRPFQRLRPLAAASEALRFFTRLPIPARAGSLSQETVIDGIAAASPLAGAAVGAGSALALAVCLLIGLPPLASAVFAVAAGVALSGALHLDGLADLADGFGGGRNRERKLALMRDSRLGTYGGAALALALFAEVALVAALAERLSLAGAALAVVAAAALARPLAFLPALTLTPARDDGLGRGARPSAKAAAIGFGLAAFFALPLAGPAAGLLAIGLAAAAAAGVSALARRQIGGYTGDVCGAAAQLAEIAALAGMAALAAQ